MERKVAEKKSIKLRNSLVIIIFVVELMGVKRIAGDQFIKSTVRFFTHELTPPDSYRDLRFAQGSPFTPFRAGSLCFATRGKSLVTRSL